MNIVGRTNAFWIFLVTLLGAPCFVSPSYGDQGDVSFDLSLGFAGGPKDDVLDIDLGPGLAIGGGMGVEVVQNLQLRSDIAIYVFSAEETLLGLTVEEDLTNVSLFFGGRYYFPVPPNIRFFGEFGLTFNSLDLEIKTPLGSISDSASEIGIAPGMGFSVLLSPTFDVGGAVRFNLVPEPSDPLFEGVDPSTVSFMGFISFHT